MKKEDIIEAWANIRKTNNTVSDEVLDFMKDSAVKSLEDWERDLKEPLEGYKTYRHESNPKEKEIHDKFIKENSPPYNSSDDMDLIVFGHRESFRPNDRLSNRERRIVISALQWLGSPVGKGFLNSCGFELINKNSK